MNKVFLNEWSISHIVYVYMIMVCDFLREFTDDLNVGYYWHDYVCGRYIKWLFKKWRTHEDRDT